MAARIVSAMMAAAMLLTACASPYADALKDAAADCKNGSTVACQNQMQLIQADADWHAEQERKAGNAAAIILLGIAVGAGAYAAARSSAPPPPPFVPAPPIPTVPGPTYCTSQMIGSFLHTNCY
jgi:CubicO group peptidase (beta-lactamase class C family)